jgi:HK97 family phage major capsid protein
MTTTTGATASGAGDVGSIIESINRSFEEFKQKNDAAIAEAKNGFSDVVRKDEIKKISDAIGEMEAKRKELETEIVSLKRTARPGDGETKSAERLEYEKRFSDWFRKGESRDFTERDLRELEKKALSVGSEPDGGFTVLPEIDQAIDATVKLVSPMRSIATVRQTSNASYRRFINIHGTTSGWVGELESRTSTTTPALKEAEIPVMEIYAQPVASQSLLDDSFVNIEQWLADEVQLEFAYQEGVAFISGTGNKKPQGLLSQTVTADTADLAYGSVGYYPTGASGAFHTTTMDPIYNMIYGLKAPYRAGASWVANRRTLAAARVLKDSYGRYLWEPSVQAGAPSMLAGYPVVEMEHMPDIAANSYSMAFGDFRRAYTIVDRIGTRVLRDPYTSKPNVIFYTTKRVGGAVTMHEAYKLLKFASS